MLAPRTSKKGAPKFVKHHVISMHLDQLKAIQSAIISHNSTLVGMGARRQEERLVLISKLSRFPSDSEWITQKSVNYIYLFAMLELHKYTPK
jgi:hypothetical protein